MKSVLSLVVLMGFGLMLPAKSQAMTQQTQALFSRLSDITGRTYVLREVMAARCADPEGFVEGQALMEKKLLELKTHEAELFYQHENAVESFGSISKIVLAKQFSRAGYAAIMFAQRKAQADSAALTACP